MITTFTSHGLTITDEIRDYAEKRFSHIERLMGQPTPPEGKQKIEPLLECDFEFHPGEAAAQYTVRAVLDIEKTLLHAQAKGTTLHEAIDLTAKVLTNEVEKIKGKRLTLRRHATKLKDFLRGFRG